MCLHVTVPCVYNSWCTVKSFNTVWKANIELFSLIRCPTYSLSFCLIILQKGLVVVLYKESLIYASSNHTGV